MGVGAIVVNLEKTHTTYSIYSSREIAVLRPESFRGADIDVTIHNWCSFVLSVGLVAAALGARVIIIYTSLSASHIQRLPYYFSLLFPERPPSPQRPSRLKEE
jgi:hypothetical protein